MLPTTIEKALDQPSISTLKHLVGEENLKLQVHYELIVLSTLVSVGGNITEHSAPFIAEQLIAMYPHETLADFKICFQRGAIGVYGPIQRLDGVTIGVWFQEYLKEKYDVKINVMMKERDNPYKIIDIKKEPVELSEVGKQAIDEMLKNLSSIESRKPAPLTDEDIRREGKEKPPKKKATSYPSMSLEVYQMRQAIDKAAGTKYKGLTSFTGFSNHTINGWDIFAKDLNDANEILQAANVIIDSWRKK